MAAQQGCSPVVSSLCLALGSSWARTQLFPHQIQLGSGTTSWALLSCYGAQCSLWGTLQPALWASSLSAGTVKIYVVSLGGIALCTAASAEYSHTGFWKQRRCSGSAGCWYAGSVGRSFTAAEQPCPLHGTLFWEGGSQGAARLCHRPCCTSTSSLCCCVAKLNSTLRVCLISIDAYWFAI